MYLYNVQPKRWVAYKLLSCIDIILSKSTKYIGMHWERGHDDKYSVYRTFPLTACNWACYCVAQLQSCTIKHMAAVTAQAAVQ